MDSEEIKSVFGDKSSSATAYMLKYRLYNPAHKDQPLTIPDDLIPEYLRKEIDTETSKMIDEQKQIEEKLLNLKLRLWYSPTPDSELVMKEVTIKKNQTLGELALLALETFDIKDLELKNIRFRTYDPKLKVKMAAYDSFETQLHKLNFLSYMDMNIETKKDQEHFEVFDPNT